MYFRKHVLFAILVIGFFNFVLMMICNELITIAIPIVMPTLWFTADQFVTVAFLLSISGMIWANILMHGVYKNLKNRAEV